MTVANALSVARGFLVVPVIGLIAIGDASLALFVFVGAAATDALDGPIARRRGATAFGAALDPLADKILVVGALAALAIRGITPVWPVILIVARELIALEVRARAPHALAATVDAKVKTVLQVAAVAALLAASAWPEAALGKAASALLVAAAALTLASGVRLVVRAKQTTADAG